MTMCYLYNVSSITGYKYWSNNKLNDYSKLCQNHTLLFKTDLFFYLSWQVNFLKYWIDSTKEKKCKNWLLTKGSMVGIVFLSDTLVLCL